MSLEKIGSGLSPVQMYEANKGAITSAINPEAASTNPVKNNKNVLMGVAAAAGIAAVVAGGILIHKNISTQKIMSEAQSALVKADDIKAEAENIFEKGKSVLDEVTDFITKGAKKNYDDVLDESGNVIRKYKTHEVDGKKVLDKMTEFAADGTKKRATTVVDGAVDTVEDFAGKVRYKYDDGAPSAIHKGYEKLSDGGEKAAEVFGFDGRRLSSYAKNYEDLSDETWKAAERFTFDEGGLSSYAKNVEELSDGSVKSPELFWFDEGELSGYCKGYKCDCDGYYSAEKDFDVVDGKLKKCAPNNKLDAEEFDEDEFEEDDFWEDEFEEFDD